MEEIGITKHEKVEVSYETKFGDGTEITSYLATGIAEGFEESDDNLDTIRAWSYLIGTKLCYSLQGWFGRSAAAIIDNGVIDENGVVDWDSIN